MFLLSFGMYLSVFICSWSFILCACLTIGGPSNKPMGFIGSFSTFLFGCLLLSFLYLKKHSACFCFLVLCIFLLLCAIHEHEPYVCICWSIKTFLVTTRCPINTVWSRATWWRCGWRRRWSCCSSERRGRLRRRPGAQQRAGGPRGMCGWNGRSLAEAVWPAWSHPDASSPWIAEEDRTGKRKAVRLQVKEQVRTGYWLAQWDI